MLRRDGETYLPWAPGAAVGCEHFHRYAFAARFAKGKRVLVLGSGEGYGAAALAECAAEVVCVEASEEAVRHASGKYARKNLRFVRGAVTAIPAEAGEGFDVVTCFDVLERVGEHDRLLGEAKRMLAPGGVFLISMPRTLSYSDLVGASHPFHVREMGREDLVALAKKFFRTTAIFAQKRLAGSDLFRIDAGAASSECSAAPCGPLATGEAPHEGAPYTKNTGAQACFLKWTGEEFRLAQGREGEAEHYVAVASDAELADLADSCLVDVSDQWAKEVRDRDATIADLEAALRARDAYMKALEGLDSPESGPAESPLRRFLKYTVFPANTRRRKVAKFGRDLLYASARIPRRVVRKLREKPEPAGPQAASAPAVVEALAPSSDWQEIASARARTPEERRRLRVAFVGQRLYFAFMYGDLGSDYNVEHFELKFGAAPDYYAALVDFDPHVAFFFRPEHYPDELLSRLRGVKVALSSEPLPKYVVGKFVTSRDMEQRFDSVKAAWKKPYDRYFHYDRTSLRFLGEQGLKLDGEFAFPVDLAAYHPTGGAKKWDWGFIGRDTPWRDAFLSAAKRDYNGLHVAHGIYDADFVEMMGACRIGVNLHVDREVSLEPRMQMMAAMKMMILSEPLSHHGFFVPGFHYVPVAGPDDFHEKLRYYLSHEEEREAIARAGYDLVRERLSSRTSFAQLVDYVLPPGEEHDARREAMKAPAAEPVSPAPKGARRFVMTPTKPVKLDLGCGPYKHKGYIGVDIEKFEGVDFAANLNEGIPFPDGSVSDIFCSHTIEHLQDPLFMLREMRRVCVPGAVVQLIYPLGEPDPTHVTIFDESWIFRNLDREAFELVSSRVEYKSGISPSGRKHSWVQQCVELVALAPKDASALAHRSVLSPVPAAVAATVIPSAAPAASGAARPLVAIIVPNQGISGGMIVLCQHAQRLAKKGYEVVLLDASPRDAFKLDWFPGLLPMVVPLHRYSRRPDVLVATHWSTAYLCRQMQAGRRIYFIQSDESRFASKFAHESEMALATYSFDFERVVIAKWLKAWLKEKFSAESSYVPNGVDRNVFYPDAPLEARGSRLRVLLEGAIAYPYKGMKQAFQVVDGQDCEVWCVSSVGRPEPGWHCDKFFQSIPPDAMRRVYSSCDLLVKMSTVEGCFMPPIEMMACGGTVLTNKVTGWDEYIVDGFNGMVVEAGDVAAAREKLAAVIRNPGLLAPLIRGGEETAPKWTWERSSEMFEAVIRGR